MESVYKRNLGMYMEYMNVGLNPEWYSTSGFCSAPYNVFEILLNILYVSGLEDMPWMNKFCYYCSIDKFLNFK